MEETIQKEIEAWKGKTISSQEHLSSELKKSLKRIVTKAREEERERIKEWLNKNTVEACFCEENKEAGINVKCEYCHRKIFIKQLIKELNNKHNK